MGLGSRALMAGALLGTLTKKLWTLRSIFGKKSTSASKPNYGPNLIALREQYDDYRRMEKW